MTLGQVFVATKPYLPRRLRNWLRISYQHLHSWFRYGEWNFYQCISLEVSVFCNRTCSYCPNTSYETPREFMSEEVFSTAIKRMQDIRYAGIVDFIFYNEPLLDPRLPELVKRVKDALPKCLPRVTTNGDPLTEDLLLRLVKAGVLAFYVTRHVPVKPGWDDRINMLAKKYPQYVTVTDIMEIQAQVGLFTRAGLVKVEKEYKVKSCRAPEGAMHIDRYGEALLCCCDYFRKHSQGNIMNQGILEIWRGAEFARIRRNLNKGVAVLDICKNCILRLKN